MGIKIQSPAYNYDNTQVDFNRVWATSPLESNNPEVVAELTSNSLIIPRRYGKSEKLPIHKIENIDFAKKKLLLPLIVGSIMTPLVSLAYYQSRITPILFIGLFLTGVFMFYFGFKGAYVLSIRHNAHLFRRFIFEPLPDFPAFINFCRIFISDYQTHSGKTLLYHPLTDLTKANRLYFKSQLKSLINASREKIQNLSIIDPMKLSSPLNISTSSSGTFTMYTSNIESESIVKVVPVEEIL